MGTQKVYESRFKLFGQTGLVILLLTLVIILTLWTIIGYETLEDREQLFMKLGWPCLGFLMVFLGKKAFFEINQILVDDQSIVIQNLIIRRRKVINKIELKGFSDKFSNGYSLLLINHSNKVVAKISDTYYQEFEKLRDNLGLTYLGRLPTLWNRIIQIQSFDKKK